MLIPDADVTSAKRRQEAKLAPQQSLLIRNELAGESKIAQLSNDGPQERLSAGGKVEANERRALDEIVPEQLSPLPPRSSPEPRAHRPKRARSTATWSTPFSSGTTQLRRCPHSFQRSLQLISLGCDPQHINRLGQCGDGFRRRRKRARRTFQRQVCRIARQLFRSNDHYDVFTKRCQHRADQTADGSRSQNCMFHAQHSREELYDSCISWMPSRSISLRLYAAPPESVTLTTGH